MTPTKTEFSEFLRAEAEANRTNIIADAVGDGPPVAVLSRAALAGMLAAMPPPEDAPRHYEGKLYVFSRIVPLDPFGGHGFPAYPCADGVHRSPPDDVAPLRVPCLSAMVTDGRMMATLDWIGDPGQDVAARFPVEPLARLVRGKEIVRTGGEPGGTYARAYAPSGGIVPCEAMDDSTDPRKWAAGALDGPTMDPRVPVVQGAMQCPLLLPAAALFEALTDGASPRHGSEGKCDVRTAQLPGAQGIAIVLRSGDLRRDRSDEARPFRVTVACMGAGSGKVRS